MSLERDCRRCDNHALRDTWCVVRNDAPRNTHYVARYSTSPRNVSPSTARRRVGVIVLCSEPLFTVRTRR